VFTRDAGTVEFHRLTAPTTLDVAEVLAAIEPAIRRVFDRYGLGDDDAEGASVVRAAGSAGFDREGEFVYGFDS
jgi:hypothetical protein